MYFRRTVFGVGAMKKGAVILNTSLFYLVYSVRPWVRGFLGVYKQLLILFSDRDISSPLTPLYLTWYHDRLGGLLETTYIYSVYIHMNINNQEEKPKRFRNVLISELLMLYTPRPTCFIFIYEAKFVNIVYRPYI